MTSEDTNVETPGQGKPVEADDSGRQRLLDAAEELFAAQGFAATTTRAISEHAGLSRGMLYYHFPSKEALFHTLIKERTPLGNVDEILDQYPGDARAALIALGASSSSVISQRSGIIRAVLRGGPSESDAQLVIQQRARPALSRISEYLIESIGEEKLSRREADAMAQTFASALLVANVLLPPAHPETFVEDMVNTLLRGYL